VASVVEFFVDEWTDLGDEEDVADREDVGWGEDGPEQDGDEESAVSRACEEEARREKHDNQWDQRGEVEQAVEWFVEPLGFDGAGDVVLLFLWDGELGVCEDWG